MKEGKRKYRVSRKMEEEEEPRVRKENIWNANGRVGTENRGKR